MKIGKFYKIIFAVVISIFIFSPFFVISNKKIYDADQIYVPQYFLSDKRVTFSLRDYSIKQTYRAHDANLSGFDIAFAYEGNSDESVIKINLFEKENSSLISSQSIKDKQISGDIYPLRVRFDPISDSSGKEYILEIIQTRGENEVDILASNYDTYLKGQLFIDDKVFDGDIYAVPIYDAENGARFVNILSDRLVEDKEGVLKFKIIWVLLFGSLWLGVLLLVFSFFQNHDANCCNADTKDS